MLKYMLKHCWLSSILSTWCRYVFSLDKISWVMVGTFDCRI